MVVSMLQLMIELSDVGSIKEKRRVVKSLKEKLISRYKVSAAEVDLQNSLTFAHLGIAVVSNSVTHGEKLMHKALHFAEEECMGRITDARIHSERF